MRTTLVAILIVCMLGIAGYVLVQSSRDTAPLPVTEEPTSVTPQGVPVFTWSHTFFPDRTFPESDISLTATYPNGVVITKQVDTATGSCNDYPERDTDTYRSSNMLICYGAGVGAYYKVVALNGAYLVQKKGFEEASPDYNPPVQPYVTIAQF